MHSACTFYLTTGILKECLCINMYFACTEGLFKGNYEDNVIIDVVNLDSNKANFLSARHTYDKRINTIISVGIIHGQSFILGSTTCLGISEPPPLPSVCAQGAQTHFIKQPPGPFERRQDIN